MHDTISAYHAFIESKRHLANNYGIDPVFLPEQLFDFQKYVAEYGIKKGRCAVFLDTGLGKTLLELTIAVNYLRHTNKPVLIITPLAVAFQFLKEAEKFGIDDIEYSRAGKFTKKIVVCNFEQIQHFNPSDFDCVIIDESSAIKDAKAERRNQVNSFLKKIQYRFLFTATPSPNDFIELGTSSEALGYLGYTDMLTKFFTNNEDTISPQNIGTKWLLKPHATEAFFQWVSSWSISARKPSDLGFSDKGYILPEKKEVLHVVENKKPLVINGQFQMFNIIAKTTDEIRAEQRATIEERCEMALTLSKPHETSVIWCNYNPESELLAKNGFQEINGSMPLEKKEEILIAFANGDLKKLVTKAKITAFGLNWQHCGHTVFFPSFSWEQYYQAIRRFWRFGRKDPVLVDIVTSDGQRRIMESLRAKQSKADTLFTKLNANLNSNFEIKRKDFDNEIQLPNFLKP